MPSRVGRGVTGDEAGEMDKGLGCRARGPVYSEQEWTGSSLPFKRPLWWLCSKWAAEGARAEVSTVLVVLRALSLFVVFRSFT